MKNAIWNELRGTAKLISLFLRSRRLDRAGRLAEARTILLQCTALATEPGHCFAIVKPGAWANLIYNVAPMSDRLGCWDGEADALRDVLREMKAACTKDGVIVDGVRPYVTWMEERLKWLAERERNEVQSRLVH